MVLCLFVWSIVATLETMSITCSCFFLFFSTALKSEFKSIHSLVWLPARVNSQVREDFRLPGPLIIVFYCAAIFQHGPDEKDEPEVFHTSGSGGKNRTSTWRRRNGIRMCTLFSFIHFLSHDDLREKREIDIRLGLILSLLEKKDRATTCVLCRSLVTPCEWASGFRITGSKRGMTGMHDWPARNSLLP